MAEIIEISRAALHEQVADRLRSMLIEGRIAPGAKLNERELCETPSCWPPKAWPTCCPTAAPSPSS